MIIMHTVLVFTKPEQTVKMFSIVVRNGGVTMYKS